LTDPKAPGSKFSSIDYSFLQVKDLSDKDSSEFIGKMNVWMVDDVNQK
jgi:hypothetical protein